MVFTKSTLVLLIAFAAACIGHAASQIQQSDTSNVSNGVYNNGVMVQSDDGSNLDGPNQNGNTPGITTTTSQIQRDSFPVESGRQNSNTDVVISNAETGLGSKSCNEKAEVRTSFNRGSQNQFADGNSLDMEKIFGAEKDKNGGSQQDVVDRESSISPISGKRHQPRRSYVIYRPEYAMMDLKSEDKDNAVSVTSAQAQFNSYSGVSDRESSEEVSRLSSIAEEDRDSYYDRLVSRQTSRNQYLGDKTLQGYALDNEAAHRANGQDYFYSARQNSKSSSTGTHGKPDNYVAFEKYAAPNFEKGRTYDKHQIDGLNQFTDKQYGNGYYYTAKDINAPRFTVLGDRRNGQFGYRGSAVGNTYGINNEDDMSYNSGAFNSMRQRGSRDIAGVNDFSADSFRNVINVGKGNSLATLTAADYPVADKDLNAYSWTNGEGKNYKRNKVDMTVTDNVKSVFDQDDLLQNRYDSSSDGISGNSNDVERFGRGGNILRIYEGNGFGVYSRNGGERDNFRSNILNRYAVENSKMQFYGMPYAGYEDGRSTDTAGFDGSRYVYGLNGKDRVIINGDDYQGYGYGLLNSNAIRQDVDSTGGNNHGLVYEKDIYSNDFYEGRFDGNGYGLSHPCSSDTNLDIMNCSDCLEEYLNRFQL